MQRPTHMDLLSGAAARALLRAVVPSIGYAVDIVNIPRKGEDGKRIGHSLLDVVKNHINEGELVLLFQLAPESMALINSSYFLAQRDLKIIDVEHFEATMLVPMIAARALLKSYSSDLAELEADQKSTTTWTKMVRRKMGNDEYASLSDKFDVAQGIINDAANYLANFVEEARDIAARRRLATGLLVASMGVIFLVLVVGAVFVVLDKYNFMNLGGYGYTALRDSLVCIAAGGAGAATSVLLRVRQVGKLPGSTSTWGAAVFRVVIGVFFALGLLFLVKSHIVDVLKEPDLASDGYRMISAGFFWAAAGFLAGFNERWVGNLLDRDSNIGK